MPRNYQKLFHIHVDATELPNELYNRLRTLGMEDTMFAGAPEGYAHFEPNFGLTLRVLGKKIDFSAAWEKIITAVLEYPDFKGYVEGEHIAAEYAFEYKPPSGSPVPFRIRRRRLRGPAADESFRASELHLTLDKDASDPGLVHSLLEMGLFGAYLPKKDHVALVLTAQSLDCLQIRRLTNRLKDYIDRHGGAARATLKEEVVVSHLFVGITSEDLPEIIDRTWPEL